jgi:hypothetical protein
MVETLRLFIIKDPLEDSSTNPKNGAGNTIGEAE